MRLGTMMLAGALAVAMTSGAAWAQESNAPSPSPSNDAQQPAGSPATPPDAAAPAAPASDFTFVFNAGAASDYIFRGVDQTNERIQGFAGADIGYKFLYAGVWTSNVDFSPFGDNSTDQEIDLYGGVKKELFGFNLDAGFIYYAYAGTPRGSSVDYYEGYLKGTRAFGPLTVGASVFYSPDFTGATGEGVYVEGNAAYTLTKKITVSGAVGHQSIEKIDGDYTTWNVGGTYAITDKVGLDLRYWDTDRHEFGNTYDSKIVASIKANFP